ncbi:hypothetical protein QBC34DRAFT_401797 [Podospora aff. communis PSN243]|uniref:F-box domain-containing protein n=1 Tax=Podospora aff. communis PSN243 TaxID=3040156 RepID=A0AAV9GS98_9PEZI|nr:hypothetical protein QBC34DRAFT_401797 [Podospora aff. communis PSN243]
MNRIPHEIVDMIASQVILMYEPPPYYWKSADRLSPYATISRSWQYAIERHLFRRLDVLSTDFSTLESILLNMRRRNYLVELVYRVCPPRDLEGGGWRRGDPPPDLRVRHDLAEFEVQRVLALLSETSGSDNRGQMLNVSIRLRFYNPIITDVFEEVENPWCFEGEDEHDMGRIMWRTAGRRHNLNGQAAECRRWKPLPVTPCIKSLKVAETVDMYDNGFSRNGVPDPRALPLVLSSVPNAEEVWLDIVEVSTETDARIYGQQLEEVAASLPTVNLQNLRSLRLTFFCISPDWSTQPGYIDHARSVSFNKALRKVATNLQAIELTGGFFLMPEFFCPDEDADVEWNIQTIYIETHPGCVYQYAQRRNWEEWVGSRAWSPDFHKLNQLAVALSRAMVYMPRLRNLILKFWPTSRMCSSAEMTLSPWVVDDACFRYIRDMWKAGCKSNFRTGLFCDFELYPFNWDPPSEAERNWTLFQDRLNAELVVERAGVDDQALAETQRRRMQEWTRDMSLLDL